MNLADLLSRTARRLAFEAFWTHCACYCALAALVIAASAWFDYVWPLPEALRWATPLFLTAFAVERAVRFRRFFAARRERAARFLDAHGGDGRTLNAYELAVHAPAIEGSAELARAEIRAVETFWEGRTVPSSLRARPLRATVLWIASLCTAAAFGPEEMRYELARVLMPWTSAPRLSPDHIAWVWPPDEYQVPYDGTLAVEALVAEPYGEVHLHVTGGAARTIVLAPAGGARYVGEVSGLRRPVVLTVDDGPFRGEPRRVRVAADTAITSIELVLSFPAYTRRDTVRTALRSDRFTVLAGTDVRVRIGARNAAAGSFLFKVGAVPRAHGALLPRDGLLEGQLRIEEGGTLELSVGEGAAARRTLLCECIPDDAPLIAFSFPPPLLVACEGSRVPIALEARDDFGLAAVTLRAGADVHTHLADGARRLDVTAELETTSAPKLLVEAAAEDIRAPVPRRTESAPRVIRVVDRAAFALLRRIEGAALVRDRIAAVLAAARDAKAACVSIRAEQRYSPREGERLLAALVALAARIDVLLADPLFGPETRLVVPITDRAKGLSNLARARAPEDREAFTAWVAMAEYFLDELIGIVEGLMPDAEALGRAQPFLRLLAEASALAPRQDDVVARLRDAPVPAEAAAREDSLRRDCARLASDLVPHAPRALVPLAEKIAAMLREPALNAALLAAADALRHDERVRALDAALTAHAALAQIAKEIAAQGEFARIDLAALVASLDAALAARDALGLEGDRVALWGPGVAPPPPRKEKPPLGEPVVFEAPAQPTVLSEHNDFYRQLAAELVSALTRLNAAQEEQ